MKNPRGREKKKKPKARPLMCPNPRLPDNAYVTTKKIRIDGRPSEKIIGYKKMRCATCGRRLLPSLQDCHFRNGGWPCYHLVMPPHKIKGWWKR